MVYKMIVMRSSDITWRYELSTGHSCGVTEVIQITFVLQYLVTFFKRIIKMPRPQEVMSLLLVLFSPTILKDSEQSLITQED